MYGQGIAADQFAKCVDSSVYYWGDAKVNFSVTLIRVLHW